MTHPDMSPQRAALTVARLDRAEHLVAITLGYLSPYDVIVLACRPERRALRRISLRELLLAQPGVGERRADAFLDLVASLLELPVPFDRKRRIQWLIDPRAGGRRLRAWVDASRPKTPPSPAFPFDQVPPVRWTFLDPPPLADQSPPPVLQPPTGSTQNPVEDDPWADLEKDL